MDWLAEVDGYCERLGPGFWGEPVNAVTNLAFVLVAAVMAWRLRGTGLRKAWGMVALLAMIGLGSAVFHTFATVWAGVADVVPIVGFVLLYLYAANRDFWQVPRVWAGLGVVAFVPFAAVLTPLFAPLIGGSAAYAPLPVVIALYAWGLRRRAPATARGLATGAGLLAVSIMLRALDMAICAHLPLGTHFAWHLLNALMLGWMIGVYRAHMLAPRIAGR